MKEGRKPEYPEKTPDDEFQKMPHNKAQKFMTQLESDMHSSTGYRLEKQTC